MYTFSDELPLDDDSNRHQSGWGRLDVHARRVRALYMEPLHIVISPNIYLRIRAMRDSPLLPGLRKIYIPNSPSLDLSSALFLASGSTLSMVELDGNAISDRQFFVPFLSLLNIKSPGLLHLAIRGAILSASVEPIYRFTELRSLEIRLCNPHIHPQLLHKLGQLPHLLGLIIDVATLIRPHTNPISIGNSEFRQLRHLHILGSTISINCILNELRGLTNLSALKINEVWDGWAGISADSSWRSSFEVISTYSAVKYIEITHDLNRPRGQYYLSASSLAPLFRLDNLKSFVTNLYITFSGSEFYDDNIRLLAIGFPELERFVVSGSLFPSRGFRRTLACLYHLSQDRPDLREIKIALSFNISDNNNLNAIEGSEVPAYRVVRNYDHPLENFYIDSDFGQLKSIQLVQVARFLELNFPN